MLRMKAGSEDITGQAGVGVVKAVVNRDLRWLFRDQLQSDVGIDAQIEPVVDGQATGQLIAVQIKTSKRGFPERSSNGDIIFRLDDAHVRYWLSHALPVIIVLVELDDDGVYWQSLSRETIISTGKGWKVSVPTSKELRAAKPSLARISEGDPYLLKLRQLQLAKPYMSLLQSGGSLHLQVDEWINKTSGRAEITLLGDDEAGAEMPTVSWQIIFPGADYEVELPKLFPWASLAIDSDYYYDHDYDQFVLERGVYDSENKEMMLFEDFNEWRETQNWPKLRPYGIAYNEVANWRLELELNRLGSSFLEVDEHLRTGSFSIA